MDSSGSLPGLGGSLAVSLVSLGVVCLLAYVALKLLSRRGLGRPNGPIKVLARCPLEPRRALYVVETAGRAAHAAAPAAELGLGSRPLLLILVMSALSLVPFALLMTTCFVKVAVVLSILRSAIGTPQVPPTPVITGLALILTVYVMAPTGERMYDAVKPAIALGASSADLANPQTLDALEQAGARAKEPLRAFLLKNAARRARATFYGLALRMR